MLDNVENGIVDKNFSSSTSYFVINKNGNLIGATSLRHYLTVEGFNTWGHIGYGVRPSERNKGYASEMVRYALAVCKEQGMNQVILGCFKDNLASASTIRKNGGILLRENDNYQAGRISQYYLIRL